MHDYGFICRNMQHISYNYIVRNISCDRQFSSLLSVIYHSGMFLLKFSANKTVIKHHPGPNAVTVIMIRITASRMQVE